MNKTYLLLGSNMGNSVELLTTAINRIEKKTGRLIRKSNLYSTAAWGNRDQPDFLNQVILIETALTANEMLDSILAIEKNDGKGKNHKECSPDH